MLKPNREILLELIRKNSHFVKGWVLDVGCGDYVRYEHLFSNKKRYITLDISFSAKPNVVGSVYSLPFRDCVYDSIVCTQLLEHLLYPQKAIGEMHRVLKPKAKILISVPFIECLHGEADFLRFTDEGILRLLKDHGFCVLKIERVGAFYTTLANIITRYFIDRLGYKNLFSPFLSILSRILMRIDRLVLRGGSMAASRWSCGWLAIAEKVTLTT